MQHSEMNLFEAAREFDMEWTGRRCRVNPLGAKQARHVARRLLNTAGAALKDAGMAGGEANSDIVALGAVMAKLDDETLDWLTDTFSKVTRIEKEPGSDDWIAPNLIQDMVFGGGEGLRRWFRWLAFCVEMSCGDFFAGLLAEAARVRQAAAQKSPNPSPGTSSRSGFSTAS
jgi:hypothetical protein